ncbi:MAG: sugar ABC transporter permease [Bacillales bacterium]|jgi:multiple sugar transport system permease protein|nr:sugar ABC transporter permease [Bacillales bacterium]
MKFSAKTFVKKNINGWLFNLPLFIGLLVFTAIPMVMSLLYSFYETDGITAIPVGFANYIRIFTLHDSQLPRILLNTIIYTLISIPLNLVLSYLLAVLLNTKVKGLGIFRVVYYLPVIIPGVVAGLLWKDIYDNTYGIFNKILSFFGIAPQTWFSDAKTAMASLLLMNVWGIGGGMILWLSAFKNIPAQLYESAKLDGAGPIRRFLHITIPLSTPMIFFNVITSIIGTLQYNGTLTFAGRAGRGPDDSLYMYGVKIYNEAFVRSNVGYGSALSWVLLIVVGLITLVLFKTSKWVFYGEDS